MRKLRLEFQAERVNFGRHIALYARIPFSGTPGDAPEQVVMPLQLRQVTEEDNGPLAQGTASPS